ncbi:MAG: BrnA antitoxin family protein [Micropepsaceae bacterium]
MSKKSSRSRAVDSDNPEWTAADFKRARPAREVVPHIVAAYLRRRGRPPSGNGTKVQVTLRLDPAVIAYFKGSGEGWQTRINDTLSKAIGTKSGVRKR